VFFQKFLFVVSFIFSFLVLQKTTNLLISFLVVSLSTAHRKRQKNTKKIKNCVCFFFFCFFSKIREYFFFQGEMKSVWETYFNHVL